MRILLRLAIVVFGILVVLWVIGTIAGPGKSTASAPYPPRTIADAHALAESAPALPVTFKRERSGIPACLCSYSVLVPANYTEKQTAAALLKAFFANKLDASPFKAVRFDPNRTWLMGFHKRGEYGNGYTAGEVQWIDDGRSRTLVIDVGGALGAKEYRITY